MSAGTLSFSSICFVICVSSGLSYAATNDLISAVSDRGTNIVVSSSVEKSNFKEPSKTELNISKPDIPEIKSIDEILSAKGDDDDELGIIKGRLEVGYRYVSRKLETTSKWNSEINEGFLGTMAYLEENTEAGSANNIFVSYKLFRWLAVSGTYDEISAIAYTETEDHHPDGEWYDKGPSVTAVLISPKIFNFISPYVEVGYHFSDSSFNAYPWWELGYTSPEVYNKLGNPSEYRKGKHRIIDAVAKNDKNLIWGVGAKVFLTDNLIFDIAYRRISNTIMADYSIVLDETNYILDRDGYEVPFDYTQVTMGVHWLF